MYGISADLRRAGPVDGKTVGPFQFVDCGVGDIEDSMNGRALTRDHHDLIVHIIMTRTDPIGVARHKTSATANQSAHDIAPVPAPRRPGKYIPHVQIGADQAGDDVVVVRLLLVFVE